MKLKKPLPRSRSYEQVLNHYQVEKAIADKLKKSTRDERKVIFATMYDELFSKVPDHPRLTRRNSEELTAGANKSKFAMIKNHIDKSSVFLEFAPGDCRFAYEVARHVKKVYGVDISDQRNPTDDVPDNFELIVYDGYNLDKIESNSIDILFSNQLLEHFHPDDTKLHLEIVHRILKPGGKYIFMTPHGLSGPFDVSAYFCDEPECFHLKEWTYTELKPMLNDLNYSGLHTRWRGKGIDFRLPYGYFALVEKIIGLFPKKYTKKIAFYLIPSLYGVAIK